MAPVELVIVLYQLSFDPDATVKATAADTLSSIPIDVLQPALTGDVDPVVLDWIAGKMKDSADVLRWLVGNKVISDDTVLSIAETGDADICDLIAENQVRLLSTPKIIEALYLNTAARMSTVDKVVDLARRNGVVLQGLPALRPLMDSSMPIVEPAPVVAAAVSAPTPVARTERDDLFAQLLEEALVEEREELEDTEELQKEAPSKSRQQFISKLSVSNKIRMAILSTREDRNILMRDGNRLVHLAAISSPKVNDVDVIAYAGNRSLPEGVITYIAGRRDWTRHYKVKVGLVNNSKVPLRLALRLLPHMRPRELRDVANSREVAPPLARQAKELNRKRTETKKHK
jgi:hypothetical protein